MPCETQIKQSQHAAEAFLQVLLTVLLMYG